MWNTKHTQARNTLLFFFIQKHNRLLFISSLAKWNNVTFRGLSSMGGFVYRDFTFQNSLKDLIFYLPGPKIVLKNPTNYIYYIFCKKWSFRETQIPYIAGYKIYNLFKYKKALYVASNTLCQESFFWEKKSNNTTNCGI